MRSTAASVVYFSSLVAFTSANAVRFYNENQCNNWFSGCDGIGPNVCCATFGGAYDAVSISKGPLDVAIGWSYANFSPCGFSACTGGGSGTLCCVSPDPGANPLYEGGSFYTISKHRRDVAGSAEPQNCTSTQAANVFGMSVGAGKHWQINEAKVRVQNKGKSFVDLHAAFAGVAAEDAVEWLKSNGAVLVSDDDDVVETVQGTPDTPALRTRHTFSG